MSRSIRSGPTPDQAIAHWRKVLDTKHLPYISHQYAREALNALTHGRERGLPEKEREPGGDDE